MFSRNREDQSASPTLNESPSDAALLTQAAQGDEAAFETIYRRHCDSLFRFIYRMVGDVGIAEDITHDAFVSLLMFPTRYDATRATLRTFLFGAGRNLVYNFWRLRRGAAVELEELAAEPETLDTVPLKRLLDKELTAQVRQAIEVLPLLQREALVLFEYEGCSLAEIATIVGTDTGTVKSRLHRARRRLRQLLTPYFEATRVETKR